MVLLRFCSRVVCCVFDFVVCYLVYYVEESSVGCILVNKVLIFGGLVRGEDIFWIEYKNYRD